MKYFASVAALGAVLGLAACSSGGGSDGRSVGFIENGQPYANGTLGNSDLFGRTFQVRLARYVTEDGVTRLTITDETVTTQSAAQSDGAPEVLSISTSDGTISFNPTTDEASFNGRTYDIEPIGDGNFSAVTGFYSYGADDDEGYVAIGFLTDPDDMPTSGTANYDGIMEAWGEVVREGVENGFFNLDADVFFEANFADGRIDGLILGDLTTNEGVEDVVAYEATIEEADIVDNAFTTGIEYDCSGFGTSCSSGTRLEGNFYGPDADDVVGIIAIDETIVETGGDTVEYIGAGGFGAD